MTASSAKSGQRGIRVVDTTTIPFHRQPMPHEGARAGRVAPRFARDVRAY